MRMIRVLLMAVALLSMAACDLSTNTRADGGSVTASGG